ncbi:MAG: bifunctional diguanylate cyclase/phosphodiesterase [Mesorhizobium amorphae]|nr:MAG: bifunctional diguanylate cyclase/phosphodiesterase [Mesorhizobium amorphae]
MDQLLLHIAADHLPGFAAAAIAVSLVGSWLLVGLLRRASRTTGRIRLLWALSAIAIAGVMAWTTHFLAMLGYRPDVLVEYAIGRTMLSFAIGVLAVGLPLAAAAYAQADSTRIALGSLAGLGIGAMHFTGMSAMVGCEQLHEWPAVVASFVVGATCYGTAMALTGRFHSRTVKATLLAGGVLAVHFIGVSGVTLVPVAQMPKPSHLNTLLSVLTAGGALVLFMGAFASLLASKRFRVQERAHATILATALDNMSNGLIFIGRDERLRLFNERFLKLFNLPHDGVWRGMPTGEMIEVLGRANNWDEEERERVRRRMAERMRLTSSETVEYRFGDNRVLEIVSGPVEDGIVLTFDDKTTERLAQSQISHMAYHDPLTGLANRRALQERMEDGIRAGQRLKLLLIDLDRFKNVNDTFGHKVGDMLLVEVAQRLRSALGPGGFAARIGGDEMAAIVPGDLAEAQAVADALVETVGLPFVIGDLTLVIGCSIGMCCTDEAGDVAGLVQRADLALYESKRRGRGQVSCYQPGMMEEVVARRRLEFDIQAALDENQFHLAFQPVFCLASSRVVGYEALIRWEHPTRGSIPPEDFIPLAEETGQIIAIGQWVLDAACREALNWPRSFHVAVNVSPVQLRSPLFVAHAVGALDKSGLAPHRLEIELTETALVSDGQAVAHILEGLRALGIRIAMDDFGTGYSSFAHLRDFPIDRIKIDRSFVARAPEDRHALAVLRAITQLGRDMGVPTLAEGVETHAQLDLLRRLGCDHVQGYLIGRPRRSASTGALVVAVSAR